MRLFIAEKPSMAAELAKCLPGPASRKDGYIVTGGGVVTWGYGHVLRQAEPAEYDNRYEKWRSEDLPIIPSEWKLLVAESCQKQFAVIEHLVSQAEEIIHAGDPDREGQLLIDEVLDYLDNQKPVQRILLNALDEKSIKRALNALRDNRNFYNLKQSALARARADWLIGMNLSRAYTLAAQRAGHRTTLPVGRVKTPTLALVVRRERELQAFNPADYFTVKADFKHVNGRFTAYWKPKEEQPGLDTEGRLADASIAKALLTAIQAVSDSYITACETVEKKEPQRLPLSLSSLQVLAGKIYGYDPQTVLDIAQKLYERKLTTYPRSDCEFLPKSQFSDAQAILANLQSIAQSELMAWSSAADPTLESRAWNDEKITAHHAIIPTTVKCNFTALSEPEQHIYFLISQAYLAQFYPVHIFNQTRVEVLHANETFVANGRVVIEMGWKTLYAADSEEKKDEDDKALPPVATGNAVQLLRAAAEKKSTKPPQRFTAATLLAAMKEIHKYVKNPELKKRLKDVAGIGTEATRATIIRELIERGFLTEKTKRKYLYPADSAYLLIDALPDEMTYPDSTAVWEDILYDMAQGGENIEEFLAGQAAFAADLCKKAAGLTMPLLGEHHCPQCKQGVLQQRNGKNGKFWGCSRYPECRASYDDQDGSPKKPDYPCQRCGQGELRLKSGKNGNFWGCTSFPNCRATYNDKEGKPATPSVTPSVTPPS